MIRSMLHRWGNSFIVVIPPFYVKYHNLRDGTPLRIQVLGEKITIEPVKEDAGNE